MSINDSYKLNLVYKKLAYGVQATSTDKAGFEETITAPIPTYDKDIWTEASLIPITAIPTLNLVEAVVDLVLTVDNTVANASTVYNLGGGSQSINKTNTVWKAPMGDYIAPTFGASYGIVVKDVNGNRVYPAQTDFFFDYASGTLVFPQGSLSYSGLTAPFKITGFRYVGKKGLQSSSSDIRIGDLSNLDTTDKTSVVNAINEIKRSMGGVSVVEKVYNLGTIANNATGTAWIDFEKTCYIRGIYLNGTATRLKFFTKTTVLGGKVVYDSSNVIGVTWDNCKIPFVDETGNDRLYVELLNSGSSQNFELSIFIEKEI